MLMEGKEPLIIFKYGDKALTNGAGISNGDMLNGYIEVASSPWEDGQYLMGHDYISGVDFKGYKKLCYRVNVPNWTATYPSWDVAIGYASNSSSYDPANWTRRATFGSAGTRSGEISLDNVKEGDFIHLLANGGTTDGNYARLYVYDLWLE